jgi:hypothetical protein
MTRANNPALSDFFFLCSGPPALRNRLTGEVEDDIDTLKCLRWRRAFQRLPWQDVAGKVANRFSSASWVS